jgi:ribulose-phosphate 3-epimerase
MPELRRALDDRAHVLDRDAEVQLLRRLDAEADLMALTKELLCGVQVVPSILSADFGRLREQVAEVLAAGARVIHVDVMDGHFVPPITVGPLAVAALREQVHDADAVIEVHLMIERPEQQVREFLHAGAHSVTFHIEATPQVAYVADLIRDAGGCVGLALNPATAAASLEDAAGMIDVALCMTVNPGWGGQQFIAGSPAKVQRLRALLAQDAALEVDGGIDPETAATCREAGANLFVAGAAIFGARDPGEAYLAIARSVGADAPAPVSRGPSR